MTQIKLTIGDVVLHAHLRATPTARAIEAALPFDSQAQLWGEEVYFHTPVTAALEADARAVVKAGELAFWVEGACIAIGFGPTPVSRGNEIRLAARTNIWADTTDDVRALKTVNAGDRIIVETLENSGEQK